MYKRLVLMAVLKDDKRSFFTDWDGVVALRLFSFFSPLLFVNVLGLPGHVMVEV